ncbi:pyridoxal phosphate-dependent transferase [Kalaharituber pfeilii]|nr:pyridoxal phosphate-dependent transferase [Kalaharituber pfeilii]
MPDPAAPRQSPPQASRQSQVGPRLSQITSHITASATPTSTSPSSSTKSSLSGTMSSQIAHPTVLIPGPVEFDDVVLQVMATPSQSHVGAPFVHTFGETLSFLRQLFITTDPASQPLVVSGSGTLGWDFVAANLVEPGEKALVLHSGYFGDSFAECLKTYGAHAIQLKAPIGSKPSLEEVEEELHKNKYKIITITHTDTSTGVLSDVKAVSELVHRVSPDTLVVVDGVCSVGCEEIQFDKWGLDVVLTASQKAIGVPAGLCIMMLSGRAVNVFNTRKVAPASYFASFANWLPIMRNYEAKKPSYFATPSPQLIQALHTSLTQILAAPLSVRFEAHKATSRKVKAAIKSLGLRQLANKPEDQSNGMTAVYLPTGITASDLLPKLLAKGVVMAGGLHREIATKYFRFGHMGVSVMNEDLGHIDHAIVALKEALAEAGYKPSGTATD